MDEREIDFKFHYPNLIILLGAQKNDNLFKQLKNSFNEFQYGPIFKHEGTRFKHELGREVSTCRIVQGSGVPICLAKGEGTLPCDAEQQAVESLFDKLCETFYVIKANPEYFKNKKIPSFVCNPDPSQSHVYKVVFLRKNSRGVPFPKPVSGAIDYVENYNELMEYIETHVKRGTKADLFILNVLKSDRAMIKQVCQKNGLQVQFLVGCSDMGIHAFYNMSTHVILQNLLKDGGKNVKYKLIGPRDKYGDNEDKDYKNLDKEVVPGIQPKHSAEEEGEIVINQWITDRLVIMEVLSENNELESTREIIWRSVRDCPDTSEFIIEKNRNKVGMIIADALIDRNVVGRARGFQVNRVKIEAAENAMQNLMKYCNYIEAKKSYFGSSLDLPYFLEKPNPIPETKIYRIADKNRGPPNKILQQFKSTCLEDLYFLYDFTEQEREEIEILAKRRNLLVRWIGREKYLCVYKRRKPNEVLRELLYTPSKENAKYKLITPSSPIHQEQKEGRATHQDLWNNQGTYHDTNVGQEAYNPPRMSDTQANTSGYQSPYDDHRNAPQSYGQGAEAPGQDTDRTQSWVRKFIQSAPIKPPKPPMFKMSRPIQPPRHRDDVYSRYKFIGPTSSPPSSSTSDVNFQGDDQRQTQEVERDNLNCSKDLNRGSTLSDRLQQALEKQNRSDRQNLEISKNNQDPSNASNKRPYEQRADLKEECELAEKMSRPSESYDRYSTEDLNVLQEGGSTNNAYRMFDTQLNTSQRRNPYDEGSRIKVENEFGKDSSKLFDRTPESAQHNNSHWSQGTAQQYNQRPTTSTGGQRSFSNLFDYNGPQDETPQGYSRPTFPPGPPPPWRKNRQFQGHSFSKLAKYGKKKRQ